MSLSGRARGVVVVVVVLSSQQSVVVMSVRLRAWSTVMQTIVDPMLLWLAKHIIKAAMLSSVTSRR